MSDHCTTKDEICNLLKELKRNETKTTNGTKIGMMTL